MYDGVGSKSRVQGSDETPSPSCFHWKCTPTETRTCSTRVGVWCTHFRPKGLPYECIMVYSSTLHLAHRTRINLDSKHPLITLQAYHEVCYNDAMVINLLTLHTITTSPSNILSLYPKKLISSLVPRLYFFLFLLDFSKLSGRH